MRWNTYALAYDHMAQHNPEYKSIIEEFSGIINEWSPPPGSTLVDLGAGTGNFSILMAKRFPNAQIIMVDSDKTMLELASNKMKYARLSNFIAHRCD